MDNYLVSIIVPVYNTEDYLEQCIKSILTQSYTKFELILINDGSKDNSLQICQKYKALDSRIKIFTQENNGLSAARNTGVEKSQGDILFFIDSDDWINSKALEEIVKEFSCNEIDLFFFNYYKFVQNMVKQNKNIPNGMFEKSQVFNFIFKHKLETFSWMFAVRTDIVKKLLPVFPIHRTYEDIASTYKLVWKSKNILIRNTFLYYYRQRENSIVHMNNDQNLKDVLTTLYELKIFLRTHKIESDLFSEYELGLILWMYSNSKIDNNNIHDLVNKRINSVIKNSSLFHFRRKTLIKVFLFKIGYYH